jgi:NAD(P)-dependent dehydrogenase (short-subunit alcohol dehydrogenase family)
MVDALKILVTGGSSGIGFAIAEKFARNGCEVVISGRNREKLDVAVSELGGNCSGILFDLSDVEEIPAFVARVKEKLGRIDVLVNNAGINQKKSFFETTTEDFERIIRVNQTALFVASREVSSIMKDQPAGGNIIHISSMTAAYGIPFVISYTASKSAVEGMTRAMAVELAPYGIRVNCIAPGFIKTPMSSKALDSDPERKAKVMSRTPMGRLGTPAEIADAAYFLASGEAGYVTGVILKVDGGNSIGF